MALPTNSRIENLRGVIAGRQHTNGFAVDMEILTDSSEAIGITINNIIKDVRSYDLQRFLHQSFQESSELRQLIDKLTGNHSNANNNNHSNSKYQNEKENKQTVKRQRDFHEDLPDAKKKMITTSENISSTSSSSETCRRVLPFVSKSNLDTNNKLWANNVDKIDVKKENFENNSKKVNNGNGHDIVNNKNTSNGYPTHSNGGHVENGHNSEPDNSTPRPSQYNTTPGKKRQNDNDQKHSDRKNTAKADDVDKNIKKREPSSSSSSSSSSSKDQGRDSKTRNNPRLTSNNNNYSNNNNGNSNNNNNNSNGNNNSINNSGEEKLPKSVSYTQPPNKSASDLAMKLDTEGRELKHIADNKQKKPGMTPLDKVGRATKYLEAGLKFVQSLDVREDNEKERFNVLHYNRIAQYFKESAHMFIDWQKDKDCPPLNLYVTLCYVCESVLLHKRNCKIVPSIKKKREERLKEIKEFQSTLNNNSNLDPSALTKFFQDSNRFMEELNDILQTDPWEKALVSSKALNNFNLPPSQITLKELVSFVIRELDMI